MFDHTHLTTPISLQMCTVCHEPLEQFWEEDEEEWHFKGAIRDPHNQLFHSNCYIDYKEVWL